MMYICIVSNKLDLNQAKRVSHKTISDDRKECSALASVVYNDCKSDATICGLSFKFFTIVIYNCNDSGQC
jgi:hypothetical protein